jgi:hypothetical protein
MARRLAVPWARQDDVAVPSCPHFSGAGWCFASACQMTVRFESRDGANLSESYCLGIATDQPVPVGGWCGWYTWFDEEHIGDAQNGPHRARGLSRDCYLLGPDRRGGGSIKEILPRNVGRLFVSRRSLFNQAKPVQLLPTKLGAVAHAFVDVEFRLDPCTP